MSDPAQLYNVDFYRWTQEQAALLRQVPGERINLTIDWNVDQVIDPDWWPADRHGLPC